MNKLIKTILRIVLCAYLCHVAYKSIQEPCHCEKTLADNYKKLHSTMEDRFNVKLPTQMHYSNVEHNKVLLVKIANYSVFLLSFLSIFVCHQLTFLVGLKNLICSSIAGNYIQFDFSNYTQY